MVYVRGTRHGGMQCLEPLVQTTVKSLHNRKLQQSHCHLTSDGLQIIGILAYLPGYTPNKKAFTWLVDKAVKFMGSTQKDHLQVILAVMLSWTKSSPEDRCPGFKALLTALASTLLGRCIQILVLNFDAFHDMSLRCQVIVDRIMCALERSFLSCLWPYGCLSLLDGHCLLGATQAHTAGLGCPPLKAATVPHA